MKLTATSVSDPTKTVAAPCRVDKDLILVRAFFRCAASALFAVAAGPPS